MLSQILFVDVRFREKSKVIKARPVLVMTHDIVTWSMILVNYYKVVLRQQAWWGPIHLQNTPIKVSRCVFVLQISVLVTLIGGHDISM